MWGTFYFCFSKDVYYIQIIISIEYYTFHMKNEHVPTYVKRIRDLREDSDYTQEYVASYLGISQTMYARYERAANELPIRHLIKLCDLYHVSSDNILGL